MTEITDDEFMIAFGYLANQLGYECGYELLRYSKVLKEPIHLHPRMKYPDNYGLLWAAMGSDDSPHAFKHDGRLYAFIRTRAYRGEKALDRFGVLCSLSKGRIQCDHRIDNDPDPTITLCKSFRAWPKSTIFWFSIPHIDFDDGTALRRIMEAQPLPDYDYGGFVIDDQVAVSAYDYPKMSLWRIVKNSNEYTSDEDSVGLRSIFPEMERSYEDRTAGKWRFLLDTVPDRVTLGHWCWSTDSCTRFRGEVCHCKKGSEGILGCHGRDDYEPWNDGCSDSSDDISDNEPNESESSDEPDKPSQTCSELSAESGVSNAEIDVGELLDTDLFEEYTYMAEQNEWIPKEFVPEYRLYRLRQKRLRRLLHTLVWERHNEIVEMLYSCPNGPMYKKAQRETAIGKPS